MVGKPKKIATSPNGQPRFTPPARRPLSVARRGDPRYVTLTHDAGGHCRGYVLTEAGYGLIAQMSADGCGVDLIANAMGIDRSTFTEIRRRDPLAQEMVDVGRSVLTSEVVDTAVQHMREGNLTACIWLGKVRCGLQEQTGEVDGASPKTINNTVNIQINAPMSDEEFARLTDPTRIMDATALPAPPAKLKVEGE